MQEYYIRRVGDEDASGPFDLDQMQSLIETGKLDQTAFFYDVDKEEWLEIAASPALMEQLFPKKRKLSLQAEAATAPPELPTKPTGSKDASSQEESKPVKPSPAEAPAKKSVSISAMLAQAEGREGDDPKGLSPIEKRAKAAFLGLRFGSLLLLGSAACMAMIEWDLLQTADAVKMAKNPYVIIGVIDAVLAFFLLLQVTELYSVVRFRAAVGVGMLTILFFASGDSLLALSAGLLSLGLYLCTASLTLKRVVPACIIGTIGLAGMLLVLIPPMLAE